MKAGETSKAIETEKARARPVDSVTESGDRLVGRAEAARLLGVSVATVRRMEGDDLTPIVGDDGVHRFEERAIQELVKSKSSTTSPETFDGPTAADVFAMLDEGISPAQIVVQKRLDPRAVKAIMRERAELSGGFYVSTWQATRIESIRWLSGSFPITSGEILVSNLEKSKTLPCEKCGALPTLCFPCAKAIRTSEVKRRAAAQAEREAEREHRKYMAELDRAMLGRSQRGEDEISLTEVFDRARGAALSSK